MQKKRSALAGRFFTAINLAPGTHLRTAINLAPGTHLRTAVNLAFGTHLRSVWLHVTFFSAIRTDPFLQHKEGFDRSR